MTENEREEFIYDIAQYQLKSMSKAGIHALAVDRVCWMLDRKTDAELQQLAPKQEKKRNNKHKGF